MFISIHTPLAGSDMPPVTAGLNRLFQSTLPLRGATSTRYPRHPRNRFQSTLPLRGATRGRTGARLHRSISIHTPLAGSDPILSDRNDMYLIFQSTLPLRGATIRTMQHDRLLQHFNPHSPCGERPGRPCVRSPALRFQSTLPLRGATQSEHRGLRIRNFNPHSPCGERPVVPSLLPVLSVFQSTLPLRGATTYRQFHGRPYPISIHTPLAGSDWRTVHRQKPQ